jgi:hypothetical protein
MKFKREKDVQRRHLIFEPIKGCKHPFIASGATPIGSAGRAPDEIEKGRREEKTVFLSLYSKYSTITSGATPMGALVAHPMKMENIDYILSESSTSLSK